MWDLAGQAYQDNFPDAGFYAGRLEDFDVESQAAKLGKIDLILASPECTNHSPAKGNQPRCEKSKETAFQVVRFAKVFMPRWIVVENVSSMKRWHRYGEFKDRLRTLGYNLRELSLKASDFGTGTSRRRLFILCDRQCKPPEVTPPEKKATVLARDFISLNGDYRWSPLKTPRRAKATLARATRALKALGGGKPFLIVYYGSDRAGGWQTLERPLRTITTLDRFAIVRPGTEGHQMRMLQVPELQAAMGMPDEFKIGHGTRRDRIRMIGNAVCPPVMEDVVRALVGQRGKD
jgi:DNA (cytosine-5)-methyltransferase 1